jgi:hypothetical protein
MSWRFRKSFQVIPGVKLNLTARGLSATVGGSPVSINFGSRGTYANVRIPGTGIWDRVGLESLSEAASSARLPAPPPLIPDAVPIRSASTEMLNSEGFDSLRSLLAHAYKERCDIEAAVCDAQREMANATERFNGWNRGFLLKKLLPGSFERRRSEHETATSKLEELSEQLRLTTISTEIHVDKQQAEPYYRMRDAFSSLCECKKIWDMVEHRAINQLVERSQATEGVRRKEVNFSLRSCELIQWDQPVPYLPNQDGGEMYIYPGFILYRASREAFALIDPVEVSMNLVGCKFIGDETIPDDAKIVGKAWEKSNKDGTPDRRFRDNRQVPVAFYADLSLTTPDGLNERFHFSNVEKAERFGKAYAEFVTSLSTDG